MSPARVRFRQAVTALIAAACVALSVTGAYAQANDWVDKYFPSPVWRKVAMPGGFGVECVAQPCGGSGLITVQASRSTSAFAEKIRAGTVEEDLLKIAAGSSKGGANFKISKVEIEKGDLPQVFVKYTCVCAGSKKHGVMKVATPGDSILIVNSLALKPDVAMRNIGRMIGVLVSPKS
jgi:hypothetical protein